MRYHRSVSAGSIKLTKYYIEQHHEDEADGKTDGAEIAVVTTGGF